MINYIYFKINRFANVRTVIIFLFLTLSLMIVINTVNIPISTPRIKSVSDGEGILDMKIHYTSREAYQILDKFQPEGRNSYLLLLIVFDFIFPFIYSLSLSLVIALLFRKVFAKTSAFQKLCLVPFFAGIFDCLENICIIIMLVRYPKFTDTAYAAGYFTSGKWIFTLTSLLLIIAGIILSFLKRRKNNREDGIVL